MEEKKETKEEETVDKEEEKKDNKKIIISIAVIVVAILAIISIRFFFPQQELDQYDYNGFTFTKQAGLWHTQWQRGSDLFNIRLRYGPRETENVPLVAPEEGINVSDILYLTFDPGEGKKFVALAASELGLNLIRTFNITLTAACTQNNSDACSGRPIITCDNTDEAVIYLREAPEMGLFLGNNCIIVQGQGEDLVRAADKLIWIQYGIVTS